MPERSLQPSTQTQYIAPPSVPAASQVRSVFELAEVCSKSEFQNRFSQFKDLDMASALRREGKVSEADNLETILRYIGKELPTCNDDNFTFVTSIAPDNRPNGLMISARTHGFSHVYTDELPDILREAHGFVLAIVSDPRSSGVGRGLIMQAVQKYGHLMLIADNAAARRFFTALGFEPAFPEELRAEVPDDDILQKTMYLHPEDIPDIWDASSGKLRP